MDNDSATPSCLGGLERELHASFHAARLPTDGNDFEHEFFVTLDAFLNESNLADPFSPLVIVGPPGCGKSTLLAAWLDRRGKQKLLRPQVESRQQLSEFVFVHVVGCTRQSLQVRELLTRLVSELVAHFDLPTPKNFEPERLAWDLPRLIATAAQKGLVLLVIDGVSRLRNDVGEVNLNWLPSVYAPNVRVILASTDPGERAKGVVQDEETRLAQRLFAELERRKAWESLEMTCLSLAIRSSIISNFVQTTTTTSTPQRRPLLLLTEDESSVEEEDAWMVVSLFEAQHRDLADVSTSSLALATYLRALSFSARRGFDLWHLQEAWFEKLKGPNAIAGDCHALYTAVIETWESGQLSDAGKRAHARRLSAAAGPLVAAALQEQEEEPEQQEEEEEEEEIVALATLGSSVETGTRGAIAEGKWSNSMADADLLLSSALQGTLDQLDSMLTEEQRLAADGLDDSSHRKRSTTPISTVASIKAKICSPQKRAKASKKVKEEDYDDDDFEKDEYGDDDFDEEEEKQEPLVFSEDGVFNDAPALPGYLQGGVESIPGVGMLLGDALAFLFVARYGLREDELWILLRKLDDDRATDAREAALKAKLFEKLSSGEVVVEEEEEEEEEEDESYAFLEEDEEEASARSFRPELARELPMMLQALGVLHDKQSAVLVLPLESEALRVVVNRRYILGGPRVAYNKITKKAVTKNNKEEEEEETPGVYRWHARLAAHFGRAVPSRRRAEELPWHLKRCRRWAALCDTLASVETFETMFHGPPQMRLELEAYWRQLVQGPLYTTKRAAQHALITTGDMDERDLLLHCLDSEADRGLILDEGRARRERLARQAAPFDIVGAYNAAVETWQQRHKPTTHRLVEALRTIGEFLAQFNQRADSSPPFLRQPLDRRRLGNIGVVGRSALPPCQTTMATEAEDTTINEHNPLLHVLKSASGGPAQFKDDNQGASTARKTTAVSVVEEADKPMIEEVDSSKTPTAEKKKKKKKKKGVLTSDHLCVPRGMEARLMPDRSLYYYERWLWIQFPWLSLASATAVSWAVGQSYSKKSGPDLDAEAAALSGAPWMQDNDTTEEMDATTCSASFEGGEPKTVKKSAKEESEDSVHTAMKSQAGRVAAEAAAAAVATCGSVDRRFWQVKRQDPAAKPKHTLTSQRVKALAGRAPILETTEMDLEALKRDAAGLTLDVGPQSFVDHCEQEQEIQRELTMNSRTPREGGAAFLTALDHTAGEQQQQQDVPADTMDASFGESSASANTWQSLTEIAEQHDLRLARLAHVARRPPPRRMRLGPTMKPTGKEQQPTTQEVNDYYHQHHHQPPTPAAASTEEAVLLFGSYHPTTEGGRGPFSHSSIKSQRRGTRFPSAAAEVEARALARSKSQDGCAIQKASKASAQTRFGGLNPPADLQTVIAIREAEDLVVPGVSANSANLTYLPAHTASFPATKGDLTRAMANARVSRLRKAHDRLASLVEQRRGALATCETEIAARTTADTYCARQLARGEQTLTVLDDRLDTVRVALAEAVALGAYLSEVVTTTENNRLELKGQSRLEVIKHQLELAKTQARDLLKRRRGLYEEANRIEAADMPRLNKERKKWSSMREATELKSERHEESILNLHSLLQINVVGGPVPAAVFFDTEVEQPRNVVQTPPKLNHHEESSNALSALFADDPSESSSSSMKKDPRRSLTDAVQQLGIQKRKLRNQEDLIQQKTFAEEEEEEEEEEEKTLLMKSKLLLVGCRASTPGSVARLEALIAGGDLGLLDQLYVAAGTSEPGAIAEKFKSSKELTESLHDQHKQGSAKLVQNRARLAAMREELSTVRLGGDIELVNDEDDASTATAVEAPIIIQPKLSLVKKPSGVLEDSSEEAASEKEKEAEKEETSASFLRVLLEAEKSGGAVASRRLDAEMFKSEIRLQHAQRVAESTIVLLAELSSGVLHLARLCRAYTTSTSSTRDNGVIALALTKDDESALLNEQRDPRFARPAFGAPKAKKERRYNLRPTTIDEEESPQSQTPRRRPPSSSSRKSRVALLLSQCEETLVSVREVVSIDKQLADDDAGATAPSPTTGAQQQRQRQLQLQVQNQPQKPVVKFEEAMVASRAGKEKTLTNNLEAEQTAENVSAQPPVRVQTLKSKDADMADRARKNLLMDRQLDSQDEGLMRTPNFATKGTTAFVAEGLMTDSAAAALRRANMASRLKQGPRAPLGLAIDLAFGDIDTNTSTGEKKTTITALNPQQQANTHLVTREQLKQHSRPQ